MAAGSGGGKFGRPPEGGTPNEDSSEGPGIWRVVRSRVLTRQGRGLKTD